MSGKKATKTTYICATTYSGGFDLTFDCVGVEVCRFALCHMMPPDGSEECTYREHGSCLCPHAKHAALKSLKDRLTKELKQLEEDCEGLV